MLCDHCHKEILDGAIFCTECGHLIKHEEGVGGDVVPTPSTPVSQAFAPAAPETVLPPPVEDVPQPVFAAPQPAFASAPMFAPQPIVAAPQVVSPYSQMWAEEGEFYHFDATEKPDFEAMRGISIALLIVSALTLVGILFPLPICIASLVMSCGGIGERNPRIALDKFRTCRTLVVVATVTLLIIILGFLIFAGAMGYLTDISGTATTTAEEFFLR